MYSFFDSAMFDTNLFDTNVFISLGPGDDFLDFRNSVVVGDLSIAFQNRVANFQGLVVGGSSVLNLANNRLGTLRVYGRTGTDEIRIMGSTMDQFFALLADGSDLLEITGSVFTHGARLDGDVGFDLFRSSGNTFNGLELLNFEAF
jgi:hypothetical protein